MFKRISEYEDKIKLYKKTIEDNINFFEKKKEFQETNGLPEQDYNTAFERELWVLKDLNRTAQEDPISENPVPHEALGMIERLYDNLDEMIIFMNSLGPKFKEYENQLKMDLNNKNLNIENSKSGYDKAFNKYKMGKNSSSAAGILKIDSYDRNIEENFYIMYYLLSYGFLGFFIYKLIKL